MPRRLAYLLRFDDVCPTMNWDVWDRLEPFLVEQQVRPIMAVVPDNQDPVLRSRSPDPHFWDRVRRWQRWGWPIALHGYQHRYVTREAGIIGVKDQSEFAGLSREEQAAKLAAGMAILEREGVRATAWSAPSHSFDAQTVGLLPRFGITIVSDGLSLRPYESREGLLWVPVQFPDFVWRRAGVYTVMRHVNTDSEASARRFEDNVRRYRSHIVTLEEVIADYRGRRWTPADRLHTRYLRTRIRLKNTLLRRLPFLAGLRTTLRARLRRRAP
jgi:predicted deacetylase